MRAYPRVFILAQGHAENPSSKCVWSHRSEDSCITLKKEKKKQPKQNSVSPLIFHLHLSISPTDQYAETCTWSEVRMIVHSYHTLCFYKYQFMCGNFFFVHTYCLYIRPQVLWCPFLALCQNIIFSVCLAMPHLLGTPILLLLSLLHHVHCTTG